MKLNKNTITGLVASSLKETFTLLGLTDLRELLDSGALGNVFSDAVDKAIESKKAEIFQEEQEES